MVEDEIEFLFVDSVFGEAGLSSVASCVRSLERRRLNLDLMLEWEDIVLSCLCPWACGARLTPAMLIPWCSSDWQWEE